LAEDDKVAMPYGADSRHFRFGLNRNEVVEKLRRIADAIEAKTAIPEELDECIKTRAEDYRVVEFRVLFAEPVADTSQE
jgi:hypothetical protein